MNKEDLYINIGNTNTTFAYFTNNEINEPKFKTILTSEIKGSNYKEIIEQIVNDFDLDFEYVFICSVVNSVNEKIEKYFEKFNKKCYFSSNNNIPYIDLSDIYNPFQLGSDILLQSFYVSNFVDEAIVVSAGTVCVIYYIKNKKFLGCIMLPGISKTIESINKNTEIEDFKLAPTNKILGSNTNEALSIGIIGNIENVVENLRSKFNTKCAIVCSGGDQEYLKHNDWWFINHLEIIGLYLLSKDIKKQNK